MLPSLTNWDDTAHSLHHAAESLGGLRQLIHEHVSNWLELGLKVVPDGLSTDKLAAGGEVVLNFRRVSIIYTPADEAAIVIPLIGKTQASLTQALLEHIRPADLKDALKDAPRGNLVQGLVDALAADGHKGKNFFGSEPFKVEVQQASDYADVLYALFTGMARFKARLVGHMTPAVVWPEHFDLAALWFVNGDMDEYGAQLNFGFAPFSEGFPRPYLYATVYPLPKDAQLPALPSPAYWTTESWTGVIVDYDAIAAQADAALFVEQICLDIFAAIRPLLG